MHQTCRALFIVYVAYLQNNLMCAMNFQNLLMYVSGDVAATSSVHVIGGQIHTVTNIGSLINTLRLLEVRYIFVYI